MSKTISVFLLIFSMLLVANAKGIYDKYSWFGTWKSSDAIYIKLDENLVQHVLIWPNTGSEYPCHRITNEISDLTEEGFLSYHAGHSPEEVTIREGKIHVVNENFIILNGDSLTRVNEFPVDIYDCYLDEFNRPIQSY